MDTDGREAAPEPHTRAEELPAAVSLRRMCG